MAKELKERTVLSTERLTLREIDLHDADFIFELLNSPSFLEFIGDKGVRTKEDAIEYIKNEPIKSYKQNGYGLWLVQLTDSSTPIGICGLINRPILDDVDIGFAFLPEYERFGYGGEIATATMKYAKNQLGLTKVIAITDVKNIKSIRLLAKLGLQFEKTLHLSEHDKVLVFSPPGGTSQDLSKLNSLTETFFSLFTNIDNHQPGVRKLTDLFIPSGTLTNNTGEVPEIFNLQRFIETRERLLSNGEITDFREKEVLHNTEVYKKVAQRFSLYEKSGKHNGVEFENIGFKTIQFIKQNQEWKMSSVVWCDEK